MVVVGDGQVVPEEARRVEGDVRGPGASGDRHGRDLEAAGGDV